MITLTDLKKMCKAPSKEKAYYRPLICNGDLSKADIFFIGINPATPVFEKDLEIDDYVNLILDYDKFISYYKQSRINKGKTEFSRTRTGINSFMKWLSSKTESSVIETEAIPYPTENLKLLWKEPSNVIDTGKDIFYDVLMKFTPRLLIMHGKETVMQVIEILIAKGILIESSQSIELSIEEMEIKVPLISFKYPNGKEGIIVACRHFMYYGITGNSFSEFRNKLEELVKREL